MTNTHEQSTQVGNKHSLNWWMGVSFFLLVVLGLIYSIFILVSWLKNEQKLPVQNIEISGEYKFIDETAIIQEIKTRFPGSFFELDVNQIQIAVEEFAWVEKASIRKDWPSRLRIYIVEQQANAIWNDDLLLNAQGSTFAPENVELFKGKLPSLYGPGGSEQTALQGYKAMGKLLRSKALSIVELQLSERFAWQVRLDNHIQLNLGRSEFIDRMQRFVDLYPLLSQQEKKLAYVDLRYDTGLAAGWQNDSQEQ